VPSITADDGIIAGGVTGEVVGGVTGETTGGVGGITTCPFKDRLYITTSPKLLLEQSDSLEQFD